MARRRRGGRPRHPRRHRGRGLGPGDGRLEGRDDQGRHALRVRAPMMKPKPKPKPKPKTKTACLPVLCAILMASCQRESRPFRKLKEVAARPAGETQTPLVAGG